MSKGKHRRPTPTPLQRAASIDSAGIASTAVLMAVVAAAIADQASAHPPVPTVAGAAVVSNAAHTAHAVAVDHDDVSAAPTAAWALSFEDTRLDRAMYHDGLASSSQGGWAQGNWSQSKQGNWSSTGRGAADNVSGSSTFAATLSRHAPKPTPTPVKPTVVASSSAPSQTHHSASATPSPTPSSSPSAAHASTKWRNASHAQSAPPSAAPSPSATSKPVGTSAPTGGSVATGAFPNASNTGVPKGITLKASGSLVITKAGTVISGLNIDGCVDVEAANVSIVNSKITCSRSGTAVHVFDGASLTMTNSEIDGAGRTDQCVGCDNYTLQGVNIHDCVDGIKMGSNDVIEGSYVHDLVRLSGTHNDAIQTQGGSNDVVKDNTLMAYNAATDDPMNAAIQTGTLNQNLSNVVVEHNYMDGGNYTVNAGATSTAGYSIKGYVFKDNVFGTDYRYGVVDGLGSGITFDSSNVMAATGKAAN